MTAPTAAEAAAAGDLPVRTTPSLAQGLTAARVVLDARSIGLFDGPPGTGKTTCAEYVAEHADRPHRIATMPDRPRPLDLLRIVGQAVTGQPMTRTKHDMEDDLVQVLRDWDGLLVVDEVQNVGPPGIAELRYLHDATRHGFAMLLVGYGAIDIIRDRPELDSRVLARTSFLPLRPREVAPFVRSLDGYCAALPRRMVAAVDSRYARGNLRKWRHAITLLRALSADPGGVDDDVLDELLVLTGHALTEETVAARKPTRRAG